MRRAFAHKKGTAVAALALACGLLTAACSETRLSAYDLFPVFGTQMRWAYVSEDAVGEARVWERLSAMAVQIEEETQRDVAAFNAAAAGERVEIGAYAYDMLRSARRMYLETDGAYNPAFGLLIDLWGFSPRHRRADYRPEQPYDREDFETQLPEQTYVSAFSQSQMLDFSAVSLYEEDGTYYVQKPSDAAVEAEGVLYTMQIDLGGIVKGYCVDRAEQRLRAEGVSQGYFLLGGSSMYVFEDPAAGDGIWQVGVASPRPALGAQIGTVGAQNTTISVSGDYELYYTIGDVRYSHVMGRSGVPVGAGSHVVCAAVVGGSAAEGDARATALVGMVLQEALDYARENVAIFRTLFVWYDAANGTYTAYTNLQGECTVSDAVLKETIV